MDSQTKQNGGTYHVPVMLNEIIALLDPLPGRIYVDATLGGGGHSAAIASLLKPGGRLIGIDQDRDALTESKKVLAPHSEVVTLVHARFDSIADVLDRLNVEQVNGALFDLGVSSYQLDTPSRGFSFKERDAALDMRMDPSLESETAADLLNSLPERELATLLRANSDEKWAARIAKFVVERRQTEDFGTVGQLIDAVHAAIPVNARPPDTHAATRTFQALRIAVNHELEILEHALESAIDRLTKGGVLTVLSYHSLEDRIVKQLFARLSGRGERQGPYGTPPPAIVELLTRKPMEPSAEEVAANPRARSAKLRAARRL